MDSASVTSRADAWSASSNSTHTGHHRNGPDAPWGGFLKSGVGRENGRDAQDAYTASKTLVVRTADQPEDWFGGDARYG